MPDDPNVAYFKDLATKTEPLRSGFKKAGVEVKPPVENKPAMTIEDEDYKYMNKQAAKIGERLSKAASKRYSGKVMPKR